MKSVVLLLLGAVFSLYAFTLDTSSTQEDSLGTERPFGFIPWFQSDKSVYYDTLTVTVPAVIVDTVRIDFDIWLVCNNAHATAELRERYDEVAVIVRTMLLGAEREFFSVRPYEKKLSDSLNHLLKKGKVLKLSLIQKNIY